VVVGTGVTEPLRPWLPPTLVRRGLTAATVGTLSYVLLDEIVADDVITFLVHRWPVADQLGRVRFTELGRQAEFAASRADVQRELYRRFRRRDPHRGDVFACTVRPTVLRRPDSDGLVNVAAAVAGVVYDISAEARMMTKLAYYGSLTVVVPRATAQAWELPAPETDPSGPAPELQIGPNR
jgi:hypothetical protein